MSKERELLGVALEFLDPKSWVEPEDVYALTILSSEIEELLAQPEQTEQEPVAWCQMVEGKVQDLLTSFEMKDWLYDKSWIPLYTAPPKSKPLSTDTMLRLITEHRDFPLNLVRAIEKAHGIGVDDE